MRLHLGLIHIEDVRFGAKTAIENHVLSIDRQELISLLQQEPLFERVDIELHTPANPAGSFACSMFSSRAIG